MLNLRVGYLTLELGPMDESEAKMSKMSKAIRNVHKISNLMCFSGTKTLVCPNPKQTLENPNWNPKGGGGKCKFHALLDKNQVTFTLENFQVE